MKVSNYAAARYNTIRPISFTVEVSGNELTATVIEIIDNPIVNELVIKFSDGYADTFQMSEGGIVTPGNWLSGKHYAKAIEEDMQLLGLVGSNELVWCIRHSINDKLCNVWIKRQKRGAGVQYSVHYHGDYYFHVKQEEGEWISKTSRKIDTQPINEELAAKVIKLVKKKHLVIPFDLV